MMRTSTKAMIGLSLAASAGRAIGAVRALVSAAMPARCPVCADPLGRHRGGVCTFCWDEVSEVAGAGPSGRFVVSLTTLGPYEGRLAAIIRRLKFGDLPGVAAPLGERLARRFLGRPARVDLVVPVPLHRRRLRSRGYNQAERIASPISRALGRPLQPRVLGRVRVTGTQTGLSRRERIANVRGAFAAHRVDCSGARILLVDDVITTGATVRECARVLRAAGASHVHVAAAARTVGRIRI